MVDLSRMTKWEMGKLFDYALLPKQTTEEEMRRGCRQAREYNCNAFNITSTAWVPIVAEELEGSDIMIGVGVGFPFGQQSNALKIFEAEEAVRLGATALDYSMNVGDLKDRKYDKVLREFRDFVKAAQGVTTKMIIETCFLTKDEMTAAVKLVCEAGIDWVKTSTGQYGGPSVQDVMLIAETVKGSKTRIKVSGVKDPRPQNAFCFIQAGAELIGTRAVAEILDAVDDLRKIGLVPAYRGEK